MFQNKKEVKKRERLFLCPWLDSRETVINNTELTILSVVSIAPIVTRANGGTHNAARGEMCLLFTVKNSHRNPNS